MSIFAAVYLDEDVNPLIAELLRSHGFDAVTTRDLKLLGTSDAEQLAKAVSLKRCLLTHNRIDFEALHKSYIEMGRAHCGIMLAVRRPVYQVTSNVALLLNSLTVDEIENQLLYV